MRSRQARLPPLLVWVGASPAGHRPASWMISESPLPPGARARLPFPGCFTAADIRRVLGRRPRTGCPMPGPTPTCPTCPTCFAKSRKQKIENPAGRALARRGGTLFQKPGDYYSPRVIGAPPASVPLLKRSRRPEWAQIGRDDLSWPKAAGPLSVANEAERTLLPGGASAGLDPLRSSGQGRRMALSHRRCAIHTPSGPCARRGRPLGVRGAHRSPRDRPQAG